MDRLTDGQKQSLNPASAYARGVISPDLASGLRGNTYMHMGSVHDRISVNLCVRA